jgi:predicted nuclease with TOPRIM domain
MDSSATWTAGAAEYASRLDEYKQTISRLFPVLPKDPVDAWSISEADILALGLLLECYPQEVTVLDVGTFVGTSAFFFASHPKVTRVVSVDPNPTVADEINDKSQMLGVEIDSEPLGNLKVLDVARAALAEFPDEDRKVQLHVGSVGSKRTGIKESSSDGSERLEAPMLELSGEKALVAFVDGLHTREGVQADLEAIFEHNPRAVAILDDCRHTWGPFVQAGVVSYMEGAEDEYDFRLLGDLGPGVATSNLGIVYPKADGALVQRALANFVELFTERLDPLRLLRREEELIATVNRYKDGANEAAKLQERNARLEEAIADQKERFSERNAELSERNAELVERISEQGERISELMEQKDQLGDRLEDRISQLREHISRIRERSSGLEEQISQLEERSSGLEEQISQLEQHNARLEERNLELRKENSQLVVYRSNRRYQIADAAAEKLLRVPGTSRLARRRPEQ